jgi:GNAT superfamily N-acetyltransferase
MISKQEYPTADLDLARRLERAEGMANAAFVEARRALQPDTGATWTEIAGVYAMFDSVSSPVTQTFGLGIFDPFRETEFAEIEAFFESRGATTAHEVCSFAASETLSLLSARAYSPIESSVVLVRPTTLPAQASNTRIVVRSVGPVPMHHVQSSQLSASDWNGVNENDAALYSRIAVQGWSAEAPELVPFIEEMGSITTRARGTHCFLGELDGRPIAAAALTVHNGVALLAGACTIPEARRQGAQLALLNARLTFAAKLGVDLAMVVTAPGSASHRNAERQGFRPVYTRAKWLQSR